ncbi:helicase RepA family protein [Sulfitobacter sp. W027]|uniref:AAA family ATPase n=1 Tax=Sulfitobacter sp. W027 TaxID=2867025 RepID=UPI0021A4655C|nr:helicase RepA family protein [Sulfitobacter sp. W027]UWR33734.1 helicase RepA family protein [Sulfitobacter sp. W027]
MRDFTAMAVQLDQHRAEHPTDAHRLPTPFIWQDPNSLPRRPWVYGRHLLRKQVAVTVAPGGVGKSSLTIVEGLAMVSERELLGEWTAKGLKVWLYNLEDPRDEMNLRITAAMQHHDVQPDEVEGRLFVDTGRERELCTAVQTRESVVIVKPEIEELAREIAERQIDVMVVDPFVSSHQAGENDNVAIDLIAKEWARLADRCNCAIELVHHTRKTNGVEATSEDSRGGSALLAAARSGRVLNRMTADEREQAGIQPDDLTTYFTVTRDKSNLAPVGKRTWRRMVSVELANGESVGVAEVWEWPDTFDGFTSKDLLAVQHAIEGKHPRYSDQSGKDWAGVIVAEVLGLDATNDKRRIRKMIEAWLHSGALIKSPIIDANRRTRPCLEVGEWASE